MHSFFWQILEVIIGIQFLFWGLNGFFNWIKPPENDEAFTNFILAAYQIRFLMPSIKLLQILGGLLLAAQITPTWGVLILTPIVFGITLLQVFHAKKPWPVLAMISIPFLCILLIKLVNLWPLIS